MAPTPTLTAVPDFSQCPVDPTTCAEASKFIAAWSNHDVDALMTMARPLKATCRVPRPEGLGGPYPLCEGATVDGEVREGFVWSSGSEGGLKSAAGLRTQLRDTPGLPLLSIGCDYSQGRCGDAFVLTFGPLPTPGPDLRVIVEAALVSDRATASLAFLGMPGLFVAGNCRSYAGGVNCVRVLGGSASAPGYQYWGDEKRPPGALPEWRWFPWTPGPTR